MSGVRSWITTGGSMGPLSDADRLHGEAFRATVAAAPEGAYFRTLNLAVKESIGFGQPVNFPRLVQELAKLEQRIADLEGFKETPDPPAWIITYSNTRQHRP